jgi:PKD repeat protein
MSQKAALRGLVLIAFCLIVASPAVASIIIQTPGYYGYPVYEIPVTPGDAPVALEAQILFDVGVPPVLPPAGTETLTFAGLPAGVTTIPSPLSYDVFAGQAEILVAFQIQVGPGTAPGLYPILVGNNPTGAGSAELLLLVRGIAISPGTVNVVAGTTSSLLSAWISPYNPQFFGTQTLVFSGFPAGVTTVPSPVIYQPAVTPARSPGSPDQALQGDTVTFQIAVSPSTPVGNYPISVQNNPAPAGTSTFTLAVLPPPSLVVAPGAVTISACSGGPAVQNSVTITPLYGYQGAPTVTFPNLPAGLTITPPLVSVPMLPPAQTVSFAVSAAAGMTAGPRTVNVLIQDQAGLSAQTTFTVNVGVPDFYPAINPAGVSLWRNGPSETVSASVALAPCPPQSSILVTPTSIPAGVTVNPPEVLLTGPSFQPATFSITASESAALGTATVTFTFSIDGGPAKTANLSVEVGSAGALSMAVESPTVSACPGGPAVTNSVTVTPLDGYTGSPTVTFPLLPTSLRITPNPISVSELLTARSVAFEITALAGALPGRQVVNVWVTDPNGPSASATFVVDVRVADFAPVVAPATIDLVSGGEAVPVTASLAPGACSPPSTITVTPTGLPAGVTVTPASAVLLAPSYTPVVFTFVAAASVPTGALEVTFVFQPSTGAPKTKKTPVSVVRNGRIGVAVERPSVDVCPGGATGSNTLTITSIDGYVGTPTVSFPGLPATLTVTPSTILVPEVPPSRVVSFTVSAAPGAPAGPMTVTALVSDSRGIAAEATFIANVLPPAFTPAVTPSAVTLNAGGPPAPMVASVVAGACAPTSDIVVTVAKSELPPGVTVTPERAVLAAPEYAPVAFSFQASSAAASGSTTITFSFDPGSSTPSPGGDAPKAVAATITICGPPAAPVSPIVTPRGNPQGPVTATDFLALAWGAPASGFPPTRYEWRINGGDWTSVSGTSASAPPRGRVDPVQLFVRAYSCNPERGPGADASSPVYSLAAPVASFSVPASIVAGRAVTFTDTSSPQATSWLWFPGDGMTVTTVQSPTVTFPSAGPRTVVLVASNGSGTSSKSTTINVLPASAARAATGLAVRSLDREPDGRLALGRVEVEPGTTLLLRRLEGEGEAVAFLRLVDADGNVVVERRLVLAAGEEARHDLSAWGAKGALRVELVGPEGLEAAVEELSVPFGEPELPVTPRRPPSAEIR